MKLCHLLNSYDMLISSLLRRKNNQEPFLLIRVHLEGVTVTDIANRKNNHQYREVFLIAFLPNGQATCIYVMGFVSQRIQVHGQDRQYFIGCSQRAGSWKMR